MLHIDVIRVFVVRECSDESLGSIAANLLRTQAQERAAENVFQVEEGEVRVYFQRCLNYRTLSEPPIVYVKGGITNIEAIRAAVEPVLLTSRKFKEMNNPVVMYTLLTTQPELNSSNRIEKITKLLYRRDISNDKIYTGKLHDNKTAFNFPKKFPSNAKIVMWTPCMGTCEHAIKNNNVCHLPLNHDKRKHSRDIFSLLSKRVKTDPDHNLRRSTRISKSNELPLPPPPPAPANIRVKIEENLAEGDVVVIKQPGEYHSVHNGKRRVYHAPNRRITRRKTASPLESEKDFGDILMYHATANGANLPELLPEDDESNEEGYF